MSPVDPAMSGSGVENVTSKLESAAAGEAVGGDGEDPEQEGEHGQGTPAGPRPGCEQRQRASKPSLCPCAPAVGASAHETLDLPS